MPLFVWISGYLLVYTQQTAKNNTSIFIRKRALKLLVPYFTLSIVALLPKYVLQPYLNDSLTLDSYSLLRTFFVPRDNVWGHFWFLPMIFFQGAIGFILDKLFLKIKWRKGGWTALTVATFMIYLAFYKRDVCPWLSVNDLIAFSWIFAAGSLCGCFRTITKLPTHNALWNALGGFVAAVALFLYEPPILLTAVKASIIAIIMTFSLIELCIAVAQRINLNSNALYAQTFTIFLLSWPCQAVGNVIAERVLQWPYYFIIPFQFMAGVIGPILIILIISHIEKRFGIHWISFILGK